MKLTVFLIVVIPGFLLQLSCSKTGGIPPPPPPDPCLSASIILSGSVVNPSVTGANDGTITLSATGGSNFLFSINGSAYQSSGLFKNLAAGNYTVIGKNSDGCTGSVSFILSNPTISCTGVNITVLTNTTSNIPCEASTASITASASGGAWPYTYSLNGGAFQSINNFTSLASGSYSITAKDANGCTGSASTTIINQPAGPLFSQVKTLIRNHCLYCHNNTALNGGMDFSLDCNIVSNKSRIKERAADGNPSPMPQGGLLAGSERQKIIDWINAGGTVAN
jgi:SprB repeat